MNKLTLATRDDDTARLTTPSAADAERQSLRAITEKRWEASDRNRILQPAVGWRVEPGTPLAEPPLSPPET